MNGLKTAALLSLILALAGVFTFTGLNWDEGTHLHPDERFLTMVATDIKPAASLAEYFNTAASRLNPANAGHSFFVYGTLPLFIVRYLAEATGLTGYDRLHLLGRFLSGLCNLACVLLIFCIGRRLYGAAAGLWAALFAACNVLFIQLSHFFIVDTFALLFSLPLLYLAVRISVPGDAEDGREQDGCPVWECLLFSFFFGLCLASKLNFGLAGLLLPAALAVRCAGAPRGSRLRQLLRILPWLVPAALIACVVFRVCQACSPLGLDGFSPFRHGLPLEPNHALSAPFLSRMHYCRGMGRFRSAGQVAGITGAAKSNGGRIGLPSGLEQGRPEPVCLRGSPGCAERDGCWLGNGICKNIHAPAHARCSFPLDV
ncbi:MAG: glycosyltransferase family 39 protein [Proteobacteria bacterium]|nr:glycosyltransferase family 39 protein [Pseudomonadota bacterium]